MDKCVSCGKVLNKTEECLKPKWCSIECKVEFYKEQFLGSSMAHNLEEEYFLDKAKGKKLFLKKYIAWQKNYPDKGVIDFIRGYDE
jgi:hypothetical protein